MNSGRKRAWLGKTVIAILGLIFSVGAVTAVVTGNSLKKIACVDNPVNDSATMSSSQVQEYMESQTDPAPSDEADIVAPEQILWGSVPASATDIADDQVHILIIGTDKETDGVRRSDVIVMCSLDERNDKLMITSFLRDLYIPIPGFPDNRINASYAFGGAELLKKCIHSNFGIRTDHAVEVDFAGFAAIIDCLGGVELSLTEQEAQYLGLGSTGVHLVNGEQALRYVRIRHIGNGDFDRTLRQQAVLAAIGPKLSKAGFPTLYKCLNKILVHVKTDLSFSQIVKLLPDILFAANEQNCKALQIPAAGTYQDAWVAGMQVLVPDLAANRAVLEQNII